METESFVLIPEERFEQQELTIGIEQAIIPDHKHHWRIEEPNGPVSRGCCKGCGEQKDFKNWLSESDFLLNSERVAGAGSLDI